MTKDEIRSVADRVLSGPLAALDYRGVDVHFERDQDGDDAIHLTVRLGVSAEHMASIPMLAVAGAMRQALLDGEEQRFPYVSYSYPAELTFQERP